MKLYIITFEGTHYTWTVVAADLVEGFQSMHDTLVQWCRDVPAADPEYFGLPANGRGWKGEAMVDWAGDYLMVETVKLNEVTQS